MRVRRGACGGRSDFGAGSGIKKSLIAQNLIRNAAERGEEKRDGRLEL
jgi:hypothetical protein